MSEDAKRFLEESKGLTSEPPWSMTTGQAEGWRARQGDIDVVKAALADAIKGAEKALEAFRLEQAKRHELQLLLDDSREVVAALRQQIYDLEAEAEAYEIGSFEDGQ